MKYKAILCGLIVGTIGAHADILTPTQAISVSDDGSATSVGTVDVGAMTGDYFIRERRSATQDPLQVSSFFQFDLSSYTIADTLTSGFNATFTIEYDSQLNALNSAPASLGRVASGDGWDLSGTDYPLHEWGFDGASTNAADTQTLIANIATLAPTSQEVTLDVTDIVTSWVDGSSENYGFVLFVDELDSQGAGFSNPELVVTIPEPATLGLISVMGGALLFMRRRFMI